MNDDKVNFIESTSVHAGQNRFRMGLLQRIRFSIERKKMLGADRKNDRSVYYDYQDGEQEEVLVRQDYIRADEINCGEDVISEKDFPWHGHTYKEFAELNESLQKLLPQILEICGGMEVKQFRRKYPDIYEAYFQRPIHVLLENGTYKFIGDGRHRIYVAGKAQSVIPVFVVEYAEVRKMTVEGFMERDCLRSWKF